jgi:hypothetical protein
MLIKGGIMFGSSGHPTHFTQVKETYKKYLKTYKLFNNGSTHGAVSFSKFYEYKIFIIKYQEQKVHGSMGYR